MNDFSAFVFGKRGELLALPAVVLAAAGKPSAFSIAAGLPLAFAGETIRMWAVGYSGVTTRGDTVTAPALVTAGPYAYVRNPLYTGNFLTAAGFAIAFTGKNSAPVGLALVAGSLAAMAGIYAVIIPHEERYLRETFGPAFDDYAARVPRLVPALEPSDPQHGSYDPAVIGKAESRTWLTFGAMLAVLALKALRA
ncbi:MAG TPA: isoprenylcysteine carboxylmethyltransferase family protein [Candidatus Limnocylindrales bacterium]|nr:isoprenylcysteine carboxylmethyltransferase family protein [Candidatus Limnocylindrales bacterium]